MNLVLAGPIEGAINSFYNHLKTAYKPHWVVCAGDYGVWPDPARMDRASRAHALNDFARYYVGAISDQIPFPTLTIAGVHDDNRWLNQRKSANNTEILNNVHWLAQGYKTTIGWETALRVTGLGRAYSEQTYNGQIGPKSHRHYTRRDIERACSSGPTDLLVVYEHLDAPGIRNVIFATRPKVILNVKHIHQKTYNEIQGIPVIQVGRNQTTQLEWEDNRFIL